jgi:triphosphoribosyl-dephospho-CoA synthase
MPADVAATLAVIAEVTAPKPGNVHRGADFEDVTYVDFVQSAVVVGPILARAAELGIGRTILKAVQATRETVATNTNLGTLLLLAPLAAVADGVAHCDGVGRVLRGLTFEDTRNVFVAIQISSAGGLGRVEDADVFSEPPAGMNLVDAMSLASDRDLVARQYCNEFADVHGVAAWIEQGVSQGWPLNTAIVHAHIRQLASECDSLILRKCDTQVAEQARSMAVHLLDLGSPGEEAYEHGLEDFDFWLRADGHRRNPGTTADLIAAALFVLLREGRVKLNQ